MDTETMSKAEAAAALGCSIRTLERAFPRGTEVRVEKGGAKRPAQVRYRTSAIMARLPAPGGEMQIFDTVDE